MSGIGGRRRNCGTDRWITYEVVYSTREDGSITYAAMLRDETGALPVRHEVQRITFDCRRMSADEAVRQAVCEFIDRTPLPPGVPAQPVLRPTFVRP